MIIAHIVEPKFLTNKSIRIMTQEEKDRIIQNIDDYLCDIRILARAVDCYAQNRQEGGLIAYRVLSEVAMEYLSERIDSTLQTQVNIDTIRKEEQQ